MIGMMRRMLSFGSDRTLICRRVDFLDNLDEYRCFGFVWKVLFIVE